MLCVYCGNEFNEKLNVPRLLITCGHSLCESCCYRLHLNSRVECPQCHSSTFIESISLLPKNLALMSPYCSSAQCAKHMKKYEAFCERENVLICIDCILSDGHKNHQMESISNCFQKLKSKWDAKMDRIQKYSQKLEALREQNSKTLQEGQAQYQQTLENVVLFFRQIREAVSREEQVLLSRLRDSFQQASGKLSEKNSLLSNLAENINLSIDNLSRYQNLSDIEFLETFSTRQSLFSSISQPSQEPLKLPSFAFSKKGLVESLSKSFQAMCASEKAVQKQLGSPSTSNYSSGNNFKKGAEVAVIKGVRKAPVPQPNPSSINLSNKKKISVKKEPSPFLPQTPSGSISKTNSSGVKEQLQSQGNCHHLNSDISAVDPKESLCHSFLSNMSSFLGQRKSIYLIGGFNEEASNIIKLNLFSWSWEEVCSLSSNRSKFGSVAINQQLYLFGGKKGKERVGDSEVYSIISSRWTKSFSMSRNRSGFAVVSLGDFLYFIGGNDGDSILNTVETLRVTTGQWRKCEPMTQARDELAVVVGKDNKIYAIGGFGGPNNEPLKSAEVYDPRSQTWKPLPSMKEPRRALAAAILADGIYAIGGFDGNNYMRSVERLEEGQSQWKYVAPMSQARCTHSAVSLSDSQEILVFGGFDYVPLDTVQKFNVISNEWESVCKMPTPRFMHSSLLIRED